MSFTATISIPSFDYADNNVRKKAFEELCGKVKEFKEKITGKVNREDIKKKYLEEKLRKNKENEKYYGKTSI